MKNVKKNEKGHYLPMKRLNINDPYFWLIQTFDLDVESSYNNMGYISGDVAKSDGKMKVIVTTISYKYFFVYLEENTIT